MPPSQKWPADEGSGTRTQISGENLSKKRLSYQQPTATCVPTWLAVRYADALPAGTVRLGDTVVLLLNNPWCGGVLQAVLAWVCATVLRGRVWTTAEDDRRGEKDKRRTQSRTHEKV